MKIPELDHGEVVRRAVDLMGGRAAFIKATDDERAEINDRWNQNVTVIGRILRAHLFVEHYLTQYLAKANPRLGSLSEGRITFSQKVALLDRDNPDIQSMLPGIRRLNATRNRLAHSLGTQVTDEDATVFLGCERFAALRSAKEKDNPQSNDPLEILESFAQHTAIAFTYEFTPLSKALSQAIREVHHRGGSI